MSRRIAGAFLPWYPLQGTASSAPSTTSKHTTISFSPSPFPERPVALIIREYVAVMLSIPPANSNRAHPPTWWYRQEKWPHALQSQHFCVGCGRERGSSPRLREKERKKAPSATTVYLAREIDLPRPVVGAPRSRQRAVRSASVVQVGDSS